MWPASTRIASASRRSEAGSRRFSSLGCRSCCSKDWRPAGCVSRRDVEDAAGRVDVLWVAYDTPVDEDDRADSAVRDIARRGHAAALAAWLHRRRLVAAARWVRSRRWKRFAALNLPHLDLTFACSPENLRLGKAIEVFTQSRPHRGRDARRARSRPFETRCSRPIHRRIEWMSVESAEMTKHAINAFLATSVTFTNELATLCEAVGADAKEVERGLKSEIAHRPPRLSRAGRGIRRRNAGARRRVPRRNCGRLFDFRSRARIGAAQQRGPQRLGGSAGSPTCSTWAHDALQSGGSPTRPAPTPCDDRAAVELCRRLVAGGPGLCVHDPVVAKLPEDLAKQVERAETPLEAVTGADALVICYRVAGLPTRPGPRARGRGARHRRRRPEPVPRRSGDGTGLRYIAVGTPRPGK